MTNSVSQSVSVCVFSFLDKGLIVGLHVNVDLCLGEFSRSWRKLKKYKKESAIETAGFGFDRTKPQQKV